MDDSQAIGAILQGDKNRYEELVGKYKRMVFGYQKKLHLHCGCSDSGLRQGHQSHIAQR